MKKLFASVLAVSLAITGIHVTSYAAEEATTVSVEAQKSNPYMSEIDKELKDFFAKYNAEKDCSKKEKLLDTAINEVQRKIDSHDHFLNVLSDSAQRKEIENKFAALKLKHSVLSTVKTKDKKVDKSFVDVCVEVCGWVSFVTILRMTEFVIKWYVLH